jgi:hypothetical protein
MVTVTLESAMPDELLQAFLQHIRDFDIAHDPKRVGRIHMNFGIEAPHLPIQTVQAIFHSIRPPFEHEWVFPGGKSQA